MHKMALLATLSLVAMALAGCSGDGGGEGDGDSTTTSSSASGTTTSAGSSTSRSATQTSTSASTTSTNSAPQNRAPTGSISSLVNGTDATFTLTGSDPDGDALVWDLDFGDGATANGTTLPATVNHTYSAGNYTASYTLTDGQTPAAYEVSVSVDAVAGFQGFSFSGEVTAYCVQCSGIEVVPALLGEGCPNFVAGQADGPVCMFTDLPAETAGRPFAVTSSGGDPDAEFRTTCEAVPGPPGGGSADSFLAAGPEAGIVPASSVCIVLWEYPPLPGVPGPSTITLTVS